MNIRCAGTYENFIMRDSNGDEQDESKTELDLRVMKELVISHENYKKAMEIGYSNKKRKGDQHQYRAIKKKQNDFYFNFSQVVLLHLIFNIAST